MRAKHFLVLEGYDPRIHAVFFCPQLYKYDSEKKLVPLEGDEIGRLIAHAVEGGITERRPWYDPSEKLPDRPIIDAQMNIDPAEYPLARNFCVSSLAQNPNRMAGDPNNLADAIQAISEHLDGSITAP